MRVLVDGVIYGAQKFGGIGRCFSETLSRIGNKDGSVEIILHLPANCRATIPKGQHIRGIRDFNIRPRTLFHPLVTRVSKARARTLRPQIFHSTYYAPPYWSGLRTVVTVHDFIYEKYPSLLGDARRFIEQKRRVIEQADAIVAVSHSTKEDILEYTKADEAKIEVIYHGVGEGFLCSSLSGLDSSKFQEKYGIADRYWLYIGKRGLYKNFGTLLRSFVRVAFQTIGHLVAVGGEAQLEPWQVDMLVRNRLEQRVRLLSTIDDEALRLAYSAAAGFVFPSLSEGFGIPILEAMAAGAPVICSDIPVFHEVAGEAALYFDPYDEESLAEAMTQVLDQTTTQSLVEKGRKRVSAFSWDTASRKLENVYKSLA